MQRLNIVVLVLSLVILNVSADPKQVLRLAADTWKPMTGTDLPHQGFSIHLARLVFEEMGYEVAVEFLPWNRIHKSLGKNRYDILSAVWMDEDRIKYMKYSEPYDVNRIVFISHSSKRFNYTGPESLEGKRVGMVSSYSYPESVMNLQGVDYNFVSEAQQNLKKVAKGRIDLTLGDSIVMRYESKKVLAEGEVLFFDEQHPVADFPLYLAVSMKLSNYQELVSEFNRIVRRYKKEGVYLALQREHGLL